MIQPAPRKAARCAIYTRKSTEHNLDLEFNSLDAQREACEAYIKSQAHEGWRLIRTRYDDGGLSGASLIVLVRLPISSRTVSTLARWSIGVRSTPGSMSRSWTAPPGRKCQGAARACRGLARYSDGPHVR
jgi:hypothetical protein